MNINCLTCDQPSTNQDFQGNTGNLGKTFIYTVLVFLALCLVSYIAQTNY